ncbi:MAG: lytic transglycosylase domain-containing protein [Gaiellaceae bacterium]
MLRGRLAALLLLSVAAGAAAAVAGSARVESATAALGSFRLSQSPAIVRDCPVPAEFRPAFETAAADSGLPLPLLVAVGEAESTMRPDAVSSAGALGLLQVLPSTAAELRLDPRHPSTNVLAGARYLRRQLDRFHSTDLALAAYHAGPTAVARAGGAPTGGTLTYVANVTQRWRALHGCR